MKSYIKILIMLMISSSIVFLTGCDKKEKEEVKTTIKKEELKIALTFFQIVI